MKNKYEHGATVRVVQSFLFEEALFNKVGSVCGTCGASNTYLILIDGVSYILNEDDLERINGTPQRIQKQTQGCDIG